jgi:hypothetical protein
LYPPVENTAPVSEVATRFTEDFYNGFLLVTGFRDVVYGVVRVEDTYFAPVLRVDVLVGEFIEVVAGGNSDADTVEVESRAVQFEEFEEEDTEVFVCGDVSRGDFRVTLQERYYKADLGQEEGRKGGYDGIRAEAAFSGDGKVVLIEEGLKNHYQGSRGGHLLEILLY